MLRSLISAIPLRAFLGDRRANVMVMFAGMGFGLVLMVGAGVDYTRATQFKTALQNAEGARIEIHLDVERRRPRCRAAVAGCDRAQLGLQACAHPIRRVRQHARNPVRDGRVGCLRGVEDERAIVS